MGDYTIRPLGVDTWDAFVALCEKHNGVWGGCWCSWFHPECEEKRTLGGRAYKELLVREGRAHAALVFDASGDGATDGAAVGWCEYGTPGELPSIYHAKEYLAGLDGALPDYRITCFFVDRDHRRRGVSGIALRGALDLIGSDGGGVVEAYPQDTQGKKISASFLYNGTRTLFEQAGFEYRRGKGKNHCVMRAVVPGQP